MRATNPSARKPVGKATARIPHPPPQHCLRDQPRASLCVSRGVGARNFFPQPSTTFAKPANMAARPISILNRRGHFFLAAWMLLIATLSGVSANNKTSTRRVLLMLTRPEKPFAFTMEEGGKTVVKGFVKDLMQELSDTLNTDIQIQLMPEGPQGIQTTNMLNSLERKKTDLIGPLEITFVNERVVDFTKPILMSGIVPVVKKSTAAGDGRYNFAWLPLPPEIFIILKPFSAEVWILTLICFVAVSLFLYVINRLNPRERRHENEIYGGYDDDFGLAGSFLFAFSCLVWQGYPRAPRSISGRILTAFWWIFIVIFLMCYTAKLVFYLNQFPVQGNRATSGQAESEGSLDALMKEGYTFGVVKNSPTYYFFRQSRIPTYQKVWSRMEDAPNASFVQTPNDGYKKAMDGNFAFLTSSLSADYALQNEPCSLMTVGGLLTSQGVGLAVSTGSPIAEKLNEAILEMRESGTIHKLYQKWWEQSGRCPKHAASVGVGGIQASELKLSEFGGAYILLIIGAVLAAIALLLEILFARRQKKKKTIVKKPEETVIVETPAETAKV